MFARQRKFIQTLYENNDAFNENITILAQPF